MIRNVVCPICGNEFQTEHNAKMYCSKKCGIRATRRKAQERKKEEIHYCFRCGKSFTGRKSKYCSDECRKISLKQMSYRRGNRKKSNALSLEEVQKICLEENISYGEYSKREQLKRMRGQI